MAAAEKEMSFVATPEKGKVSALLIRPAEAKHLLVLGHGASTNMRHATLATIAERLSTAGVATLRYNFPFMEHGRGRDSKEVCTATVRSAVAAARAAAPGLRILAGGHSFGGRMTSTAASESPLDGVDGLVFFSFPLHPPGQPDTKRAEHLSSVTVPMLFLSGTRDDLADLALLRPVVEKLGARATLHLLDTADHGFRVLKRSRKISALARPPGQERAGVNSRAPGKNEEDVFDEMARVVREWTAELR
jgi:predicted alpha/beta-hydrolase family hydrolase